MNRKVSHLRLVILTAIFGAIYLFTATQPVSAVPSAWVRWKINLSFPKDTLDSQLTIQRGHTTQSGEHIVDEEKTFALPCQAVGTPTISGGAVTFDGTSYVTCAVPSIQEQAWQLWQMSIADRCSSKRPYVRGEVTIESNPIDTSPENPLFYRHDIQFEAPLTTSTQAATLKMAFGQEAASSGAFAVQSSEHTVAGHFSRSGPSSFSPSFVVDGNSLSATPATISQAPVLSNLQSRVYFGYSPLSGEFFEGVVGPLEVDPVCPTTG